MSSRNSKFGGDWIGMVLNALKSSKGFEAVHQQDFVWENGSWLARVILDSPDLVGVRLVHVDQCR